jgi:hypothetical protein
LKEKHKLRVELVPSLDAVSSTPFLPSQPRLLEVADVPIMIGVTTHEGMLELKGEIFLLFQIIGRILNLNFTCSRLGHHEEKVQGKLRKTCSL